MVPETRYPIRVRFSKTGSLKFISHLDLDRTMKAAFLRSKLPIWYTMGFNPHPKLSFSLPLSVGTASLCEFMDFMFTEPYDAEDVLERLNKAFPADLRALEVYKPKTIFHDIGWAEYEIRIMTPACSGENAEKIRESLSGQVVITKTSKVGTREVDISGLYELESCDCSDGCIRMMIMLSSSENSFVNPKHILEHIESRIPGLLDGGDYTICRTEVFLNDKVTKFR